MKGMAKRKVTEKEAKRTAKIFAISELILPPTKSAGKQLTDKPYSALRQLHPGRRLFLPKEELFSPRV